MVELLCTIALSHFIAAQNSQYQEHLARSKYASKYAVCREVAQNSVNMGVDPILAVSVTIEESGFESDLVSKAGARGPLQIIPRYFCPNSQGEVKPHSRGGIFQGCDLNYYGVYALGWFLKEYEGEGKDRGVRGALCHYNSGTKCNTSSRAYAQRIILRYRSFKAQIEAREPTERQDEKEKGDNQMLQLRDRRGGLPSLFHLTCDLCSD